MGYEAIIAAAGRGERLGLGIPKALVKICGKTVVERVVDKFVRFDKIRNIYVAVPPGYEPTIGGLLSKYGDRVKVYTGGTVRQESIHRGLKYISDEYVLIHDVARMMVTDKLIERVMHAVTKCDAVVPVIPVRDTIKEVDDSKVLRTLPRERLYIVQTPQGFRTELIVKAYEKAQQEGYHATDSASLVERYGVAVSTVEGEVSNIKLTYGEDVRLVECMLMVDKQC